MAAFDCRRIALALFGCEVLSLKKAAESFSFKVETVSKRMTRFTVIIGIEKQKILSRRNFAFHQVIAFE